MALLNQRSIQQLTKVRERRCDLALKNWQQALSRVRVIESDIHRVEQEQLAIKQRVESKQSAFVDSMSGKVNASDIGTQVETLNKFRHWCEDQINMLAERLVELANQLVEATTAADEARLVYQRAERRLHSLQELQSNQRRAAITQANIQEELAAGELAMHASARRQV